MAGSPMLDDDRLAELDEAVAEKFRAAAQAGRGRECLSLVQQMKDPNGPVNFAGRTLLMTAAENGLASVCGALLDKGALVDARDDDDRTALFLSVDNVEVCRLLVQRGADVSLPNFAGDEGRAQTALDAAARYGYVESCQVLIEASPEIEPEAQRQALCEAAGCDRVAVVDLMNKLWPEALKPNLEPMLVTAASEGAIRMCARLIELGATLDGSRALIEAAGLGRRSVCKFLIESGADVGAFDAQHFSAIHAAASAGEPEVVRLLVSCGAEVNCSDGATGWTALHGLVEYCRFQVDETLRALVECGADSSMVSELRDNLTPFQLAVRSGRESIVGIFLEQLPEDLEQKTLAGQTLADLAVDHPELRDRILSAITESAIEDALSLGSVSLDSLKSDFAAAVLAGDVASCRVCLEGGADVNQAINQNGHTALLAAAYTGNLAMCALLLENGADVNSGGPGNFAPIFEVLENTELCKLFVNHGLDVSVGDAEWNSPLAVAARAGKAEVCDALLGGTGIDEEIKEAALSAAACAGQVDILNTFLQAWPDINAQSVDDAPRPLDVLLRDAAAAGKTEACKTLVSAGAERLVCGLVNAASNGHIETCRALLDLGANVNGAGWWGERPLHCAVSSDSIAIVRLMLERGADVHIEQSSGGWTPVYRAIQAGKEGRVEMVRALIDAGADIAPLCADAGGRTPFQYAVGMGDIELTRFFIEACAEDPGQLTCEGLTLAESVSAFPNMAFKHAAMHQFLNSVKTGLLVGDSLDRQSLDDATMRPRAAFSPL
jgi:ankyrin repeat protein